MSYLDHFCFHSVIGSRRTEDFYSISLTREVSSTKFLTIAVGMNSASMSWLDQKASICLMQPIPAFLCKDAQLFAARKQVGRREISALGAY